MLQEPPDGAYVLAEYQSRWDGPPAERRDPWQVVWQRLDRGPGQERGDWWEVRPPGGFCKHCGTTRELGVRGPDSWGVVCGLDDPEPYGVSQIRLWSDDECEPWAVLERFARWLVSLDDPDPGSAGFHDRRVITLARIIDRARQALEGKE